jgi:hypothetical protein
MKIAIMQPTFLPWVGYFDLIDRVDRFVYLDTVPFTRQSWQHRNRIKTAQGLQWLTLPVNASASEKTPIRDVTLGPVKAEKLCRSIEQSYARAPHFAALWPRFQPWLKQMTPGANLADLNIGLIETACEFLGLETPRLRASALTPADGRVERLIAVTRELGGSLYLSPMGAAGYLAEAPEAFPAAGLELAFQAYEHPAYRQLFPPFAAGCGFLDLLFNAGPDALALLRGGRRPDRAPGEAFAMQAAATVVADQAA